jgi:hypothetical protein
LNLHDGAHVDHYVQMKRSKVVTLTLVPAAASWFMACRAPAPAYQQLCTDQANVVVDDQRCDDERRATHRAGYVPIYRYYYAPFRGAGYAIGELVSGGSIVRPSAGGIGVGRVVRGGFGSTAHGSGAGA